MSPLNLSTHLSINYFIFLHPITGIFMLDLFSVIDQSMIKLSLMSLVNVINIAKKKNYKVVLLKISSYV